jgi:hypothetical protein
MKNLEWSSERSIVYRYQYSTVIWFWSQQQSDFLAIRHRMNILKNARYGTGIKVGKFLVTWKSQS